MYHLLVLLLLKYIWWQILYWRTIHTDDFYYLLFYSSLTLTFVHCGSYRCFFHHTRADIRFPSRRIVIFSRQQRLLSALTPPDDACGFTSASPRCSPPVIPHFFKFALVCFLLSSSSPPPPHFSVDAPLSPPPPPPPFDSCPPDPLAGATPPIGRLSRCVHPLSLTTTSRARRATWRTPSRALHALHPLIRGTARTGTPLPLPSMPLYTSQTRFSASSPLLLLLLYTYRASQLLNMPPPPSSSSLKWLLVESLITSAPFFFLIPP